MVKLRVISTPWMVIYFIKHPHGVNPRDFLRVIVKSSDSSNSSKSSDPSDSSKSSDSSDSSKLSDPSKVQ